MMNNKLGLYIHIPFCHQICSYCDFVKRVSCDDMINKYFDALLKEFDLRVQDGFLFDKVTSIYIGGGTPSSIKIELLDKLFNKLKSLINFENIEEFTFEANPEDLDVQLIDYLFSNAVNRVSIGVQTLNPTLLKLLNRKFDYQKFKENIKYLKTKIPNFNIDLMYAIPNQTVLDVEETIKEVLTLDAKHLSIYSLILEEKTCFYKQVHDGILTLIDEDTEISMVNKIQELLEGTYNQYEVSNYAQKGYESKHNLLYWSNLEYLGVGLGAASYIDHTRFNNEKDLSHYINDIANLILPIRNVEHLLPLDEKKYHVILGFRKIQGIDLIDYQNRYHTNIYDDFPELWNFLRDGYFIEKDHFVFLNKKYLYVMNYLLERII